MYMWNFSLFILLTHTSIRIEINFMKTIFPYDRVSIGPRSSKTKSTQDGQNYSTNKILPLSTISTKLNQPYNGQASLSKTKLIINENNNEKSYSNFYSKLCGSKSV